MFLEYYGFREQPFGVTPDPRFIYFGPAHREALASLLYAIETKRGFSAMVAEPGMGKTSLLFRLLESLRSSARTAFLFQTNGDSKEILRGLLADLGIKTRGKGVAAMHADLNKALLEELQAGRKTVLVIDEAQNLDESALESIRLLSNFETATEKLMHIVLAGQPRLAEMLARADLVQLKQRVSTVIQLRTFRPEEVAAYVKHRLQAAGYEGQPIFSSEALQIIARVSRGIPRDINSLCFQALSIGFAMQRKTIGADTLREVVSDFEGERTADSPRSPQAPSSAAARSAAAVDLPASVAASFPSEAWHPTNSHVTRSLDQGIASPSPPPLQAPAPIFWNYDPPIEEPVAHRGRKGMVALACVVVLLGAILVFSDPSLGLTATAPGQISSHIVDAVLSSGDPNSDFLPATPNAMRPPIPPPIETTQISATPAGDSTGVAGGTGDASGLASQQQTEAQPPAAEQTSRQTQESAQGQEQANDVPQTSPRGLPQLPEKTERVVAPRRGEESHADDEGEFQYRGPSTVQVEHRENLFEFSLETFGRSNLLIVEKICELNPTISGPYAMLSAGEWVRLPTEIPADPPEMHSVSNQQER
jgi:type II secretory pathway predicted ATPase ExeA